MAFAKNKADQALDIKGSISFDDDRTLADESSQLGAQVSTTASMVTIGGSAPAMTIAVTGGSFTAADKGKFAKVSGASNGANNGEFVITAVADGNNITIANASGVTETFSGVVEVRKPYSLEDDINFARTDRKAIKGTADAFSAIPTYQRPSAVGTNVPANLTNIAGKTTDAKALVMNRQFSGVSVAATDTQTLLTDSGNLKHADATDRRGVPIQDGADSANLKACYCEVYDSVTGEALKVLGGGNAGDRIYGIAIAAGGTSPNSFSVKYYSSPVGGAVSTSDAYTWEAGQPTTVDIVYPYRELLSNLDDTALRTLLVNGLVGDADLNTDVMNLRAALGIAKGDSDFDSVLTNTTDEFIFAGLGANATAEDIFNILNEQIGDRTYTGSILTTGEEIVESLQALADAIAGASFVRTVERLAADITANTAHTIPGSQTYTIDGAFNGANMRVSWRGLLRDPGVVANGNDYEETSTTSITPFSQINDGDHINYEISM